MGSPIGLYGAERWILALVKHLSGSDFLSFVGVIRDEPDLEQAPICAEAEALGLSTVHFDAPGKLSLKAIGQMRRFIDANAIDVVHTHGYKTDLIGLFAVRGTAASIVSTPHGWSTDAGLKLQVYEHLDRAIFPFMDAVVPLSGDIHSGLDRNPFARRKLHLIQNGVDLSEVDAVDAPERDDGGLSIGYVGQLIPRKGLDCLIRAFSRIDDPAKSLVLVGEGESRADLERLAADLDCGTSVRFLGYRDDRLELLKSFDMFVLPSSLEGIPRCLMESMAAGVPIVASDIPGTTDLIKHRETGLLFRLGDDAELEQRIRELAADAALRQHFSAAGRRFVEANHSAQAMAGQYAELYRAVAGEG